MIAFKFQSTTRITFSAVGYLRFHFFPYNLLLTSPSFIRIQFKTLKLVYVISSFVQFSFRSIELIFKAIFELFSRRKSLLYFFPGAFNIKLVNSFILVWHSDYELSSKTQKPFFILKEGSKCHDINYRAKNHVVMFCFGLQSIARFINTKASYFNTLRLESEGKFPETFKSQLEKIKNVIHPPIGLTIALGQRPRAVLKTSGTGFPNMDLPAGE